MTNINIKLADDIVEIFPNESTAGYLITFEVIDAVIERQANEPGSIEEIGEVEHNSS